MKTAAYDSSTLWAIGIGTPLVLLLAIRLLPSLLTASDLGILVRELVLIILTVGWVVLLYKKAVPPLYDLGLGWPSPRQIGWGGGAALATLAISVLTAFLLKKSGFEVSSETAARALAARPAWIMLLIIITAAVTEELTFRAVLIPAVESACGSSVIAITVSAVLFSLPHINTYGASKAVVSLVPGFVMGILFIQQRNVYSCILGHALLDFVAMSGMIFGSRA